ncbi:hypothetical protein IIB34_08900 [PVC group bacterium]|nr:hypothetical protein [PVC group bacterium]
MTNDKIRMTKSVAIGVAFLRTNCALMSDRVSEKFRWSLVSERGRSLGETPEFADPETTERLHT